MPAVRVLISLSLGLCMTVATLTCQQTLDAYCNTPATCLDPVHGKFSGALTALHDGTAWRCYAAKDLNPAKTKYISGSDYCTRDKQLSAINAVSPCNGTLPPAPPTPTPLPGSIVFKPELEAGVACYRIPAVMQTLNGTLLAFAEARYGSCGDGAVREISFRRSTDGGKTWSPAAPAVGSADYLVGNPSAVALADGRAMLIYVKHSAKCEGDCGTGNGLVVSEDDGITWSPPQDLSADFGAASGSLPGPGTALQLEATVGNIGRILVPSHHSAYQRDYVSYSDDGGKTWDTINQTFPSMDEAALTQLPNGSVLLNMRHRQSPKLGRAVARSDDGGLHFGSITYDHALISPVCQASIVSFNGVTFFSNPATTSGRSHTSIRRSTDNAVSWSSELLVEAGASAGYSCLVKGALIHSAQTERGGILYEAPGSTIEFADFPLDF